MKMNLLTILLVLFGFSTMQVACDDGTSADGDADTDTDSDADSDSDTDSDTDADGDFPGNCDSAARFTFDGELIDICSTPTQYSRCFVPGSTDRMTCMWYSGDNKTSVQFANIEMSLVEEGATYTSGTSFLTSLGFVVNDVGYSGTSFSLHFDKFEGIGGVASGTFTADTRDNDNQEPASEITNGQFYAPIIQE